MTRIAIGVIALLAATTALPAQEGFIQGTYFNSREACAIAREGGAISAIEEGYLLLTPAGITGYEYHCDFLDLHKARSGPNWLAVALCEEPGVAFTDLIAIAPRREDWIDVNSLATREGPEMLNGTDPYYLCEGVDAP